MSRVGQIHIYTNFSKFRELSIRGWDRRRSGTCVDQMWNFQEWNFIYEKVMGQMWYFHEWSFLYKSLTILLDFRDWIYVYKNVTYGPSQNTVTISICKYEKCIFIHRCLWFILKLVQSHGHSNILNRHCVMLIMVPFLFYLFIFLKLEIWLYQSYDSHQVQHVQDALIITQLPRYWLFASWIALNNYRYKHVSVVFHYMTLHGCL